MIPISQAPEPGIKRYAEQLLRANVGKKVIVVLNFSGNFPPEKRTFEGWLIAVGIDFFMLSEETTGNDLLAFFVNLAYLSFFSGQKPNIPVELTQPQSETPTPSQPKSSAQAPFYHPPMYPPGYGW